MKYNEPQKVRLQKFLALCGISFRRRSEHLIASGEITMNGEIVKKTLHI